MSNITKTNKMGLLAVFIAASLFVGTFAVIGTEAAFADKKDKDGKDKDGKKKHGKKVKINEADQVIAQPQSSTQSSTCISGVATALSCNNVAAQLNLNLGNNALGQQ
ncbi:MAG: hypothetical protein M3162_08000 [Thermoproteota archaeon]|nr:hypothetical protein [Thermoproteota archaeon]